MAARRPRPVVDDHEVLPGDDGQGDEDQDQAPAPVRQPPRRPRQQVSKPGQLAGRAGGWRPSQSPAPSVGQQGAGVILALFAYPFIVNTLKGGPSQGWKWVRAKWINAGAPAVGTSSSASATPADPGTGTYLASYTTPTTPAPSSSVVTLA